ncbi:MAG: hypothetical protein H7249_09690 [Chitinophagaceae bacterium]|nr:hypothetical protein [Oligoflexus sp.]
MVRKLSFPGLGSVVLTSSILWACGQSVPFAALDKKIVDTTAPALDAKADITKTFNSGKTKTVSLRLDSGFNNLTQAFALEQNPRQQEKTIQIERTIFNDTFTQGNKGINATQSFSVAEAGIFDLLLVIDNSSSMAPYQGRLSKTLPDILRHISNTNWRIAVVTSSSPCLRKTSAGRPYLTRKDFDNDSVAADADFQQMIRVGETGNPIERGIYMMTQAMQETGCDSGNISWLRPDSQRAVLLLTDEKNCGSAPNEGCPGMAYEKADYFYDRVGKTVTVNAMLLTQEPPSARASDPTDPNHDCENSGGYETPPNPTEYYRLVADTGGRYGDICRSNYSTVLDQISQDIGTKINVAFELAFPAELSSLDIKVDGMKINSFNVNGKILSVYDPLTVRSGTLVVNYKHDPVPMVKSFTPQHPFDTLTIEVFVNGTALIPKDYSFNVMTGKVELRDLPPESAIVKVRYRDNAALPKIFGYLQTYYLDTLEVSVNGVKTTAFTVDKIQKKITLADAPRDGQAVFLTYELPGDRHVEYPVIGVLNEEIESYVVVDSLTGASLNTTLGRGTLTFDPADVRDGRKVEARYNLLHDFKDKTFVLQAPALPFPDTLKIAVGDDNKICAQNVTVTEGKISFQCAGENFPKIDVTYQYADDYTNTFDIAVPFSGPRTYRVFIAGVESTAFTILGEELVILKKNLPPDTEVKVIMHPNVI